MDERERWDRRIALEAAAQAWAGVHTKHSEGNSPVDGTGKILGTADRMLAWLQSEQKPTPPADDVPEKFVESVSRVRLFDPIYRFYSYESDLGRLTYYRVDTRQQRWRTAVWEPGPARWFTTPILDPIDLDRSAATKPNWVHYGPDELHKLPINSAQLVLPTTYVETTDRTKE